LTQKVPSQAPVIILYFTVYLMLFNDFVDVCVYDLMVGGEGNLNFQIYQQPMLCFKSTNNCHRSHEKKDWRSRKNFYTIYNYI